MRELKGRIMAAGIYNIIVERGGTFERTITWTDEDGNNPDLSSGYTAELVISDDWGTAALLTLTESSGLALAAGGVITITITPTQSEALEAREHVWHLQVKKTSSGKVDRLLKGVCAVEPKAGA